MRIADYPSIKENTITGRYVTNARVLEFLKKLPAGFTVDALGYSEEGRPIKSVTWGNGPEKILMWSQMHGNETTTTKALLDIMNLLGTESELSKLKSYCTLKIIPVLNPDGAEAYTRVNANGVDLNRDAQERSQLESKVLRKVYDQFGPGYCLNLHDQRTIFNVGQTAKPATVSFLAPAFNKERNISASRELSMKLVAAMNKKLQNYIPGQIGRYDDSFNANCVGDAFQMLNTPTVLFEAGHFPDDYQREKTREYIFYALIEAISTVALKETTSFNTDDYFSIPANNKLFFDILIKNAKKINPTMEEGTIGILFVETLNEGRIDFVPKVTQTTNLKGYNGHVVFDCSDDDDMEELKKQSFWEDIQG